MKLLLLQLMLKNFRRQISAQYFFAHFSLIPIRCIWKMEKLFRFEAKKFTTLTTITTRIFRIFNFSLLLTHASQPFVTFWEGIRGIKKVLQIFTRNDFPSAPVGSFWGGFLLYSKCKHKVERAAKSKHPPPHTRHLTAGARHKRDQNSIKFTGAVGKLSLREKKLCSCPLSRCRRCRFLIWKNICTLKKRASAHIPPDGWLLVLVCRTRKVVEASLEIRFF